MAYILILNIIGLAFIILKQNKMATKQDLLNIAGELRSALSNIGDDITRLTDQIANGGISDDVIAEFRSLADGAKAIADRTPEEPTEPEVPVTPEA